MMNRFLLGLTICLICFVPASISTSDTDELITKLKDAGMNARTYVKAVKDSQPNRGDLLTLKAKYNAAKDAYSKWADEAADAVSANKKININSELAKQARKALDDLAAFGDRYEKRRQQLAATGLNFDAKTEAKIQTGINWAKDIWPIVRDLADRLAKEREQARQRREDIARNIRVGADWPEFDKIT
jgi:hypothetical protein